jgi:hypothetical protein
VENDSDTSSSFQDEGTSNESSLMENGSQGGEEENGERGGGEYEGDDDDDDGPRVFFQQDQAANDNDSSQSQSQSPNQQAAGTNTGPYQPTPNTPYSSNTVNNSNNNNNGGYSTPAGQGPAPSTPGSEHVPHTSPYSMRTRNTANTTPLPAHQGMLPMRVTPVGYGENSGKGRKGQNISLANFTPEELINHLMARQDVHRCDYCRLIFQVCTVCWKSLFCIICVWLTGLTG